MQENIFLTFRVSHVLLYFRTNLPSLLPSFPLGALTPCQTHNPPSGGSSYLEEAHLCFTNCIFRSPSHTAQLTWHIPKISVLPLLLRGGKHTSDSGQKTECADLKRVVSAEPSDSLRTEKVTSHEPPLHRHSLSLQ